jgi:SPP1 family phage portal protein
MYYTQTQLIKREIISKAKEINSFMLMDLISKDILKKEKMHEGVRYYNYQHDIFLKKREYWSGKDKKINELSANHKIPHPFFRMQLDEKASYICGKPIRVTTKEPAIVDPDNPTKEEQAEIAIAQEFQTFLTEQLGNKFNQRMLNWVRGAGEKGAEVIHFYIDPDGNFNYIILPAEEVILVYDTQYQDRLTAVIRYYAYDFINIEGKAKTLYKVEYWTAEKVTYYEQREDGAFELDSFYGVNNPQGHWQTFNELNPEGTEEQHSWGRPPFVVLKNNDSGNTDLEPIKLLIDVYDKVVSGFADDLQDFQEVVLVLKGYINEGSIRSEDLTRAFNEIAFLMDSIKQNKMIFLDKDGEADTLKVEIPVEAKIKFLELTRKAIHYFGRSIDRDNDDWTNPSGVALKILYQLLNEKAEETITQMKLALDEFFWFITTYINQEHGKNFDPAGIVTTFNKAMIFNEKEIIDALNSSKISDQTYLEKHPYIDDAEEEQLRMDRERRQRIEEGMADLSDPEDDTEMPMDVDSMTPEEMKAQLKKRKAGV